MSAPPHLGRRWLLGAVVVSAISPWSGGAQADRRDEPDCERVRRQLVSLLREPEQARRLGTIYLRSPLAPRVAPLTLAQSVLAKLGPNAQREAVRDYIADRIRCELETVEVVSVDGWIMSSTEAQLCGLAALSGIAETRRLSA
jgi:hypothetical protein